MTPPLEPVRPRTLVTLASLTGATFIVTTRQDRVASGEFSTVELVGKLEVTNYPTLNVCSSVWSVDSTEWRRPRRSNPIRRNSRRF